MPLWSILCALLATACLLGDRGMAWAAFILLVDWCGCTALYWATGDQFMWPVLAAIDYTAALLLVTVVPSRITALIAVSYVLEGLAHVAFGFSAQQFPERYSYWWVLHRIAWGQAWLLVASGVWSGGKKLRRHLHHSGWHASAEVGALRRRDGGDTGR